MAMWTALIDGQNDHWQVSDQYLILQSISISHSFPQLCTLTWPYPLTGWYRNGVRGVVLVGWESRLGGVSIKLLVYSASHWCTYIPKWLMIYPSNHNFNQKGERVFQCLLSNWGSWVECYQDKVRKKISLTHSLWPFPIPAPKSVQFLFTWAFIFLFLQSEKLPQFVYTLIPFVFCKLGFGPKSFYHGNTAHIVGPKPLLLEANYSFFIQIFRRTTVNYGWPFSISS